MGVGHYENFPVASLLAPPALRDAIRAIYRFARTADDIADEGNATPEERLSWMVSTFKADSRTMASFCQSCFSPVMATSQ